ncbi:hypothetical protein [Amphibacillus cookii]|uniref:hypothetical protein n=1 Tax=Amphibacillus cookii TaxID=767787 RepID=UPI001956EF05|nr:hypothetical protein [Amphibacillus cookii]MBM7542101.1 hypothetical protein [Amphibacillus cookii]
MRQNLFYKSILVGACVGGALSLIHPQTRAALSKNISKAKRDILYVSTHPSEIAHRCSQGVNTAVAVTSQTLDLTIHLATQFELLVDEFEKKRIHK